VVEAIQTSQNLDSLRSSHPIEVPVKNALEVVGRLWHHIMLVLTNITGTNIRCYKLFEGFVRHQDAQWASGNADFPGRSGRILEEPCLW